MAFPTNKKSQHAQQSLPFFVPCYKDNITMTINTLTAATSYNLSVKWISPNKSLPPKTCSIVDSQMFFKTSKVLHAWHAFMYIAIHVFMCGYN